MKNIKVEICCGSVDDVFEATRAGASRVEFTSCMFLGGLTPSVGALQAARKCDIEIMAMIRPREGAFCYTEHTFEAMCLDARALLDAGADGIVFGVLHPDGTVDAERCQKLVQIADGKPCVFHRAIDVTPDWRAALDTLIDIGVTRVLTSGQAPTVPEGIEVICDMIAHAAGRIEILPGGGIRPHNVHAIVAQCGCDQVHLSLNKSHRDASTAHNPAIHFGGALYPPEDLYKITDADAVARFLTSVESR